MSLTGKSKKAQIEVFKEQLKKRYPDESPEVIQEMAERKYNRNHRHFMAKIKVAFLAAILTLGVTLSVQGLINKVSATDFPQISYEYFTDDQKELIESLDGKQLLEYIQNFNTTSHPESLVTYSDKSNL